MFILPSPSSSKAPGTPNVGDIVREEKSLAVGHFKRRFDQGKFRKHVCLQPSFVNSKVKFLVLLLY